MTYIIFGTILIAFAAGLLFGPSIFSLAIILFIVLFVALAATQRSGRREA